MALTYGSAPFSPEKSGQFNFSLPDSVLYWEEFPKRMRVIFNDEIIVDSREAKALHETGQFMVLYFPRRDVKMELLNATDHQTKCPHKGTASYWSVQVDKREAKNAVWSYEDPKDSVPFIRNYMAFYYNKMDDWFEDDEKVYEHLRNPYHGFEILPASNEVIVHSGEEVIAETSEPLILYETGLPPRYYMHPDEVKTEMLGQSEYITHCPYKGNSRHWHLKVNGETIDDAAWSMAKPIGEAKKIADYLCFYPNKVQVEVDGETLKK